MASTVHISAHGDEPVKTVKRQEGKYNFGLYCSRCTQFFALAVLDDPPVGGAEFKSDGEPLFACPFCHHRQRRQVSEIVQLFLVRGKKRTPSFTKKVNVTEGEQVVVAGDTITSKTRGKAGRTAGDDRK